MKHFWGIPAMVLASVIIIVLAVQFTTNTDLIPNKAAEHNGNAGSWTIRDEEVPLSQGDPATTPEKETADTMPGVSRDKNEQGTDPSASDRTEDPDGPDDDPSETVSFDAEAKNDDGKTETLVHVEADAGTFPDGTTMEASVVTDQDVIDSIMDSAEGQVVAVHAVDLTFTDENGETVQPAEGSQVSVTLSPGEGGSSDPQKEEAAADSEDLKRVETLSESAGRNGDDSGEDPADGQNTEQQTTETTVVQYSEDKGVEAVETNEDVSFRVEPENDMDRDTAVSFDMAEQAGDPESQTYAIVETVTETNVKEDNFTEETDQTNSAPSDGGAGPEAEKPAPEEEAVPAEGPPKEEVLPPAEKPLEEAGETVLTAHDKAYFITMTYGPEAQIPQGASLKVEEILTEDKAYDEHLEETQKVLNEAAQAEAPEEVGVYAGPAAEEPRFFGARSLMADPLAFDRQKAEAEAAPAAPEPAIVYARFFDIIILDADGNEVTPAAPVKVAIELLDTEQDTEIIQNADAPQVIHFGEEETELVETETLEDTAAGVTFDAEGFSVYGVVYTVDFHLGVYSYSIHGGSCISLRELFEVLGIKADAEGVKSVAFSDPSLVWVGKVKEAGTVGELKEANGLEVEYSAELTEEQIAEINARTVEAGEWAMISLKPFDTEESLTVTMKDGKAFTIQVTDAQIRKTVIDAKGDTWEITVTYGEDAQLPDGAELKVREITEATEHRAYVTKTQESLGCETDDTSARFFDISIMDQDGNEIQPAAEVSVEIRLLDTEIVENMQVVHLGETAELMDRSSDSDSLSFQTDGFSVFAVVVVESEEGSYVFRGEGFTVTITHTAEAQIPLGTILTVEEIEFGSKQYDQRLGQVWSEINREYLEIEAQREHYEEWMGDLPDVGLVNLDCIRFFDIRLLDGEEIIEPNVPVQVEIAYDDGIKMTGEVVSGVVHYTEDTVELIDEVDTVTEGSAVLAFKYEQASFSDTGTYVGQKTYSEVTEPVILPAPVPMQYPTLEKSASPNMLRSAANGKDEETGKEEENLPKPVATKTLTPNKADSTNDGTYTLELAVDGRAKSSTMTEIKKSNVLIVMDRSSSMVNNYPNGEMNSTPVATHRNNQYVKNGNSYSEFVPQTGVRYYGKVNSNGSDRYRELNYMTYTDNTGTHYRWTYVNTDDPKATVTEYKGTNIYTGSYTTRLSEEQRALSTLIRDLLGKNGEGTTDDGVRLDDLIEISVISFARTRSDKEQNAATEVDWSTDYNKLMAGVNSGFAPPGTNWENALRYAMEKVNAKKNDESQAGEDFYIIFLTDGEPTATKEHDTGAYYYEGSSNGSFINAYYPARDYIVNESGLANSNYNFYGIFTWGQDNEKIQLLKRLVNVAHGNTGSEETNYTTEAVDEDGVDDYFYDADSITKLEEAFGKIFSLISDSVGYEQVSITDGLTTDAMTTTLVDGSTDGFEYTVYRNRIVDPSGKVLWKGTPVYTVTARDNAGGEPTVTFNINGTNYPAGPSKPYTYEEVRPNGSTERKTKFYYSVTVGTGDNAVEYKMALAEKNSGRLTWDLAAIGALENGYTYAVSFTVWPNQDAYDYVAALNNGLTKLTDSHGKSIDVVWNSSVETDEHKVTDSHGRSYWKGGVSAYPSIVKYKDGTFAVLTNTDQTLKYVIASTETVDDQTTTTYDGPYTKPLDYPDPMELTVSALSITKHWDDSMDPQQLKDLVEYYAGQQSGETYSVKLTMYENGKNYKGYTFSPEWDDTQNCYTWKSADFSIAPALLVSKHPGGSTQYKTVTIGNKIYYVLNDGHEYTLEEEAVDYHFEFSADSYHPALVDGVLYNVEFDVDDHGYIVTDSTATIRGGKLETFTGTNTLKGRLYVEKKTEVPKDTIGVYLEKATFDVKIELTGRDGNLVSSPKDENGNYNAETGLMYRIHYGPYHPHGSDYDPSFGNYGRSGKKVVKDGVITETLYSGDVIYVGNIPVGTHYEVEETSMPLGWKQVSIVAMNKNENENESYTVDPDQVIYGNKADYVTITNTVPSFDINILKTSEDGRQPLGGAHFKLYGADYYVTDKNGNKELNEDLTPIAGDLVSDTQTGLIPLGQLGGGEYYLVEVSPPAGYLLAPEPIHIIVSDASGQTKSYDEVPTTRPIYVTYTQTGNSLSSNNEGVAITAKVLTNESDQPMVDKDGNPVYSYSYTLTVTNSAGYELPSTGGHGTRLYAVLGTVLTAGLVLPLWKRRALP